ncbi:MAG TPA: toll-Interleukin receptor [Verrucomicrobiae bacterium]|nr:toll-Interleukin receptor [Verrucomicrobiae bacterium]
MSESLASTGMAKAARAVAAPDFSKTPTAAYDIFLSHSSLDARLIYGIFLTLTDRGYSVYLDRICDPQLDRSRVSQGTARTLRYRMAQSRSLFVCTTDNTPKSQWVPWELGFSDGWKDGKAAVLPITDASSFQGQEYFDIYPEVKDAGMSHEKPSDLEIWDHGKYVGPWGSWISQGRTW